MADQNQTSKGEGSVSPIQVQKSLKGIHYPAKKQDLINRARENQADDNIMRTLQMLPEQSFSSPNEVSKSVAKHH